MSEWVVWVAGKWNENWAHMQHNKAPGNVTNESANYIHFSRLRGALSRNYYITEQEREYTSVVGGGRRMKKSKQ